MAGTVTAPIPPHQYLIFLYHSINKYNKTIDNHSFFLLTKIAIERMNGSLIRNQITNDLMLNIWWLKLINFDYCSFKQNTIIIIIIYQWSFANLPSNQTSKSLICIWILNMHMHNPIPSIWQNWALGIRQLQRKNRCINNKLLFKSLLTLKCVKISVFNHQFSIRSIWHAHIVAFPKLFENL